MDIDESWGHGQSVGINFAGACASEAGADLGDDTVAHGHIGDSGWCAGAINNRCIADH
jgi:hypothetical protein